jgi:hypothetical protein
MSNHKQQEIDRLRKIASDENESPIERLIAATKLLSRYGPTQRSAPIINATIKEFINHPDFPIQQRATKLKKKFVEAKGLKEVAKTELPDENPESTATEIVLPAMVAGTSASEVPKALFVTFDGMRQAFVDTVGNSLWHLFSEGHCDLTLDQRTAILEKILDEFPLCVASVQSLLRELNKKNQLGWSLAVSFPALVRIAEEFLKSQGVVIEEEQKEPDGFQCGFIDPQAAVDRVVAAGYKEIPKGASDSNLLQAALGDVPLDEKSVGQLWLTLGYWFKEKFGGAPAKGSNVMPGPARWIMACICGYANPRYIKIISPNVFTFEDSAAFRS